MKSTFKTFGLFFAALGLGALSSVPARADVGTIQRSNNAYWGAVGAFQINYKESVDPIPNSQRGWVPSVALGMSYMGAQGLYLAFDGSLSAGSDRYRGALYNAGTGLYDIPHQEDTNLTMTTLNGRAGRGFLVNSSVIITPYLDLGFRYWERDLNSFTEVYRNFEILGGVLFQYSPTDRLVFSAYGAAGTTFEAEMELGSVEYPLGSAAVYKAGGKIGYNLSERLQLFTSLDYNHFRFVKSEVIGGMYEPSSRTDGTALRVGLAYQMR